MFGYFPTDRGGGASSFGRNRRSIGVASYTQILESPLFLVSVRDGDGPLALRLRAAERPVALAGQFRDTGESESVATVASLLESTCEALEGAARGNDAGGDDDDGA